MSSLVAIIASVIVQLYPRVPVERAQVYGPAILAAAEKHGIEWEIMTAIVYRESRFQPQVISKTNDWGIGQHHCPSFFCAKNPTPEQKACLLDPICNLDVTGQELAKHKYHYCKRKGKQCTDWVQLYNPGSKGYAQRVRDAAGKIKQLAARLGAAPTAGVPGES